MLASVAVAAAFAVDFRLAITKKTILKGELEDLITFGLLKEMTCDSNGNIFSPSNRKYSSAINAIVRFPFDASSYTEFSIDSLKDLTNGTITDFDLEPNGELFVLARQVLKFSDVEVPMEFGDSFVVHYDKNGQVLSQLRLRLDSHDFSPTGIAVMKGGEYLVVGYHQADGKTFVGAEIFQSGGNLKTRVDLSRGGTKSSKRGTVASLRVVHPAAIKANGLVYVLRGTTTEPVYVLSESGKPINIIQLKPTDVEFDSPMIQGKELIIHEHRAQAEEESGFKIHVGPQWAYATVFNLESGEIADHYYWNNITASLACRTSRSFILIGQDQSTPDFKWTIFEEEPVGAGKPMGTVAAY